MPSDNLSLTIYWALSQNTNLASGVWASGVWASGDWAAGDWIEPASGVRLHRRISDELRLSRGFACFAFLASNSPISPSGRQACFQTECRTKLDCFRL